MKKRVILFFVLFAVIFLYAYLLTVFFEKTLWLFAIVFVYLMFFVIQSQSLKRKALNEELKIKDRKEIRIDFWHVF